MPPNMFDFPEEKYKASLFIFTSSGDYYLVIIHALVIKLSLLALVESRLILTLSKTTNMTEEATLQFISMDDLWAFRIETMVDPVDMDKDRNILVCKCSSYHLKLAISKYKAAVLVNQKS
jgi:hypothetical protein